MKAAVAEIKSLSSRKEALDDFSIKYKLKIIYKLKVHNLPVKIAFAAAAAAGEKRKLEFVVVVIVVEVGSMRISFEEFLETFAS